MGMLMRILGVGVGLAALGLAVLYADHLRSTSLPSPTGVFGVGRIERLWADTAIDPRSPPPGHPRQLMAWVWYPTAVRDGPRAPYLPDPWRRAFYDSTHPLIRWFLRRSLSAVHAASQEDPPIACPRTRCKVLLLRGGASALVAEYATLAEDLASHGYVVVGVDAPYRTFVVVDGEGRRIRRDETNDVERVRGEAAVALASVLVNAWSADLRFSIGALGKLDFADRLDLDRVGAVGHSLGGASVLQFCHDDARCQAVVDLDGAPFGSVVQEGLAVPALLLLGDHAGEVDSESRRIGSTLADLFEHLPPSTRRLHILQGATHFGFADDNKSPLVVGALCGIGHRMLPREQLAQTRVIVREFFDATL